MPFDLQTRLLRVLSDGQFYRVGGHAAVKAHVRVIAATHQNLEQRVKEGGFREDLFHRLNVIRLRCPRCASGTRTCPCSRATFCSKARVSWGWSPSAFRMQRWRGWSSLRFRATCGSWRTSATG
jgi:two-component system nitrogen regulation response regulator GlnG